MPEEIKTATGQSLDQMEQEQENLETEVNVAAQEMDREIIAFSTKIDEMKTPEGKVIAKVKRPTSVQWQLFIPYGFSKYKDGNIPEDVAVKYEDGIWTLISELIIEPKHSKEEWQKLVGDDFVALFQAHLFSVKQKLSETVKSFLPQT